MASNLNLVGGETIANRVVVPVGTDGQITVYDLQGTVDVVEDVDAYFTDGSSTPALRHREPGQGARHPAEQPDPLPRGALIEQMASVDGIASNASAVVTNITAADTTTPSFTVYPDGPVPVASDLNWVANDVAPNLIVATLSDTGSFSVYNDGGKGHRSSTPSATSCPRPRRPRRS